MGCCGPKKDEGVAENKEVEVEVVSAATSSCCGSDGARKDIRRGGGKYFAWTSIFVIAGLVLMYFLGR